MQINEIKQKLNGVRKSQSGFIAECPAHDDKKQSLKIDENGGRVLLKCFAGCPPDKIVKAMGIEWKDRLRLGKTVEDGGIFVAHIARCGDKRNTQPEPSATAA